MFAHTPLTIILLSKQFLRPQTLISGGFAAPQAMTWKYPFRGCILAVYFSIPRMYALAHLGCTCAGVHPNKILNTIKARGAAKLPKIKV